MATGNEIEVIHLILNFGKIKMQINDTKKSSGFFQVIKATIVVSIVLLSLGMISKEARAADSVTKPNVIEIDLGDSIGPLEYYKVVNNLLNNATEKDTVKLLLHNFGGSSTSMAYISNAIERTKAHVIAKIDGPTFSAGAFIACFADEVDLLPNSSLMFHLGSMTFSGTINAQTLDAMLDMQKRLVVRSMGECKKKGLVTDEDIKSVLDGKDVYVYPSTKGKVIDEFIDQPTHAKSNKLNTDHCVSPSKDELPSVYIKSVFDRLIKASNQKGITIRVTHDKYVNAAMCSNGILEVTQGLVDFTREDVDMLAGIIAHEIGHHKLKHTKIWPRSSAHSRILEKAADIYAFNLMPLAGYNQCDYVKAFKKLLKKYGNEGGDTHPSTLERIKYLECHK